MIRLFRKGKWPESRIPANSYANSCSFIPLQPLRYIFAGMPPLEHRSSSSEISGLVGNPNPVPISTSKFERLLNSSERPEMVRQFLLNRNFSEKQVESIMSRWPQIQLADPEKTLKSKFDCFHSWGFSEADIIKIVSGEPKSLARSVENYMIPLFDLLKSVVGSKENVARVMKSYPFIFRANVREALESNLATLRECGVPDTEISKLIVRRAQAITPQPSRFLEAIAKVQELGFDPLGPRFGYAITAIGWCSKATWESKMHTLRSYGLSDDEIHTGFRAQPLIMMLKEPNIKAKMEFFVKTLNWSPSKLMISPFILMYSLEERIIRRLSVLHFLASEGFVKEVFSVQWFLIMAEKKFLERYVMAFKDEVPRVLEANQGKWRVHDWSSFNINAVFKKNEYVADDCMSPCKKYQSVV